MVAFRVHSTEMRLFHQLSGRATCLVQIQSRLWTRVVRTMSPRPPISRPMRKDMAQLRDVACSRHRTMNSLLYNSHATLILFYFVIKERKNCTIH